MTAFHTDDMGFIKSNIADDLFLSLVMRDCAAKAALISLGTDPSAMRSQVARSRTGAGLRPAGTCKGR